MCNVALLLLSSSSFGRSFGLCIPTVIRRSLERLNFKPRPLPSPPFPLGWVGLGLAPFPCPLPLSLLVWLVWLVGFGWVWFAFFFHAHHPFSNVRLDGAPSVWPWGLAVGVGAVCVCAASLVGYLDPPFSRRFVVEARLLSPLLNEARLL